MARMSAHSTEEDFSVAPNGDGFDLLTDDLRARIKGELESGERLLWAARSEPPFVRFGIGFYFWSVITAIVLGVGAVGIVRSLISERFNDGSEMTLGVVLVVVASMLAIGLTGNWLGRMKQHRQDAMVCYAITERRAIIWTPERKSNAVRIRTFPRGEIRNLVRVQAPDGSGSLLFAPRGMESMEDFDVNWSQDGFRHIRGVRRVEQIVRNNLMNGERFA